MQAPFKITFRNVRKTPDIVALIGEQAAKLELICNSIVNCQMAVEGPQQHPRSGNPFRVRIGVTVPPEHEVLVIQEGGEGNLEQLPKVLRGAFSAMRRQLRKLTEKQRKQLDAPPPGQEAPGFVSLLLRKEGYGFIKSLDGRDIYFHRNTLLEGEFDRLGIGTGVCWAEGRGEKVPQASSVRIVSKPASQTPQAEDHAA